jgi:N-acetylmuramoyl-L-alanine amidase
MTLTERLLTVNPFSRPGTQRGEVQALIMHWTAVPLQPAWAVRNYFESRKAGKDGYGSAHYIIDQDGSIIRCIPEAEIAFHVGSNQPDPASGRIYTDWARAKFGEHATNPTLESPNACTLGIEMCPLDAAGNFSLPTLAAAVELARDICMRLALNPLIDIATHNMVVGWKDCPRLWVNHREKLTEFRAAVAHSASAVENERTGT